MSREDKSIYAQFPYTFRGVVVRCVDGDTLDILFKLGFNITYRDRVRLRDIDTPELYHPKCDEEKAHALAVQEWMEDNVFGRRCIVVTQKTGKYGRWIADVVIIDDNDQPFRLSERMRGLGFEKLEDYDGRI